MMQRKSVFVTLALSLLLAFTGAAFAQNTAALYFVHGAPGRDVAMSLYPSLPVDVLIDNSMCLIKNAQLGEISKPYTVAPGAYNVKVSPANVEQPCSNTAVFDATVQLKANTATFVVAGLGPRLKLTGYVFDVWLGSPVPMGKTKVIVAHSADAPPVEVGIVSGSGAGARTPMFSPGQTESLTLASGDYAFDVYVRKTNTVALGPIMATLHSRDIVCVFAYGSAYTGTLNYAVATIPGVY